jgi:hypothetical protein
MPSSSEPETLLTCPDCGQENFSARGLQAHQGGKTCRARASKLSVVTVEPPTNDLTMRSNSGDSSLSFPAIVSLSSNLDAVNVIRWLESALPVYERSRGTLARQAVMIGYALICIRDFCPRGSLAVIKKMQVFSRSRATLDRCIKAAQIYAENRGLLTDKGQIQEPTDTLSLFQPEFDFNDPSAHPLSLDIAQYVGDANIADLLEKDILGDDDGNTPPNGHQKDAAKNRTKETPDGIRREAFKRAFKTFSKSFHAHEWTCLYQRGAPDLVKTGLDVGALELEEFLSKALAAVSAHNKEAANKERSKKGGKSC